jgi:hypothetical protein
MADSYGKRFLNISRVYESWLRAQKRKGGKRGQYYKPASFPPLSS